MSRLLFLRQHFFLLIAVYWLFADSSISMAEQELLALVKRLEAVASKLEGSAPGSDTSGKCKILLQTYFY